MQLLKNTPYNDSQPVLLGAVRTPPNLLCLPDAPEKNYKQNWKEINTFEAQILNKLCMNFLLKKQAKTCS